MKRLWVELRTAWRTAVGGLRASLLTSAVAAGTIATSLLLIGLFALLLANMQRILERFGEELHVSAYLEEGLSARERADLREHVSAAPGVLRVELVTPAQALEHFGGGSAGRAALLEGLEDNPLPASLEITLAPEERSRAGVERLAAALDGVAGIADLGTGTEWVEGYARATELVRGLALALGLVLAGAALLIVANTIRLAIYARRDEIEILRLVGASRSFVAVPFLIEGSIQGLLGGLLGLGGLFLFYATLLPTFRGGLELLLGDVEPVFLGMGGMLLLVGAGMGLGALGSALALLQGADS